MNGENINECFFAICLTNLKKKLENVQWVKPEGLTGIFSKDESVTTCDEF